MNTYYVRYSCVNVMPEILGVLEIEADSPEEAILNAREIIYYDKIKIFKVEKAND